MVDILIMFMDNVLLARLQSRFKALIAAVVLLCVSLFNLHGEEVWFESWGYGLNVPGGWELKDFDPDAGTLAFADSAGKAFAQVFSFPLDDDFKGRTTEDMMGRFLVNIGIGEAEITSYPWDRWDASLADVSWETPNGMVRGYALGASRDDRLFIMLSYAMEEAWEAYHDFLVSVADSFFPEESMVYRPGAISVLISDGAALTEAGGLDAELSVVEREARVLATYQQAPSDFQMDAWRRFYQMIFRDSFSRLEEPAVAKIRELARENPDPYSIAARLLSWLQDFDYVREGTLADLTPPFQAWLAERGDCDSLVLLYGIFLEYAAIDWVLLVSPVHAHSWAGVDVDGEGARYEHDGVPYLLAETTENVAIGLVAANMANTEDWFAFDIRFRP